MITQFKHNSYRWSVTGISLIAVLGAISMTGPTRATVSASSASPAKVPMTMRLVQKGVWDDVSISRDGKYLCDIKGGSIAIRESATGEQRTIKLTKRTPEESDPQCPIMSPDNKTIAYLVHRQSRGRADLCLIEADGSGQRVLYPGVIRSIKEAPGSGPPLRYPGLVRPIQWFPDGSRLLAIRWPDPMHALTEIEIVSVSIADGSVQVIKTLAGEFYRTTIRLSPDAKYVAYELTSKDAPAKRDIFAVEIDSRRETPLVGHAADDGLLDWTPDGGCILFTSDRVGAWSVWLLPVVKGQAQGSPELVARSTGDIRPVGFAQNGSYYYRIRYGASDIYTAAINMTTGQLLSAPAPLEAAGSNRGPDWSPDGKYLAYCSNRGTSSEPCVIHIRSLATGEERELANKLTEFKWLRWSPDGRSLLASWLIPYKLEDAPLSSCVYRIDAGTGDSTILLDNKQGNVQMAELSPDGKTLYYTAKGIIRREIDTGQEKTIFTYPPKGPWAGWALSPNGESIATGCNEGTKESRSEGGVKKVLLIPSQGGQPTELLRWDKEPTSYLTNTSWSPDGKTVLFMLHREPVAGKNPKTVNEFWQVSIDGGPPRKIMETDLSISVPHGFRVHPEGQRIAFSATTVHGELWVMENFLPEAAAPVAKPEPMTTVRRIGGNWGTFASLSPDGRYLCDVDWDTENLAVLEPATGKVRHLTNTSSDDTCYPLESAISPGSKEVAYLWFDHKTRNSSLRVVGLDGSGDRLLCEGKYPMPRAWSADGKKILAVISENDVQQMVWISASDGSMQRIASFDGESLGYPGKFDISPDSRFIAYDRPQAEKTSQRDIFLFDLIDNREFSIVEHPSDDKLLGWTPDGRCIFFASDRAGRWDAWLQQVAGGKPQGFPRLAKGGIGEVRPIGFTPDGSYYYAQERILEDVFTAKLDSDTGEVLSEPVPVRQTGTTACHDFSPDGAYLAYCERRPDESRVIHVRTLATGRERTLAENLPYIRWLRWSLDGRSLVIDGAKMGDSQGVIFKIDVQTGERSDLVHSETEVLIRPEMSPDGKVLYYARSDPKSRTMRLMGRDIESGRERELIRIDPPARLTGSALSPDGQRLVLSIVPSRTGADGPVLKTISTGGGQPVELLQFGESEKLRTVGVTWMPDSRDVLFWKWFLGDRSNELWRISVDGGEPRKLWSRKALGHMRVHPDGQHIAFHDRSTTRGVWVMENFLPQDVGK